MSSRCITPFEVKQKITNQKIPVPCGKCPPCMKRRTSGWSFRLVKEGDISTSALFVTLTYDNEHVPKSNKGFKNLDKTHVQKFMKRIRKLSNQKLKYYAIGEYGTKFMRPHYHLILFNADKEQVNRAWALDNKKIGNIYIGTVTEASIGYVLKYMTKKGKIPMHKNDDRLKEFSLMSKGLGKNYLTEQMVKWHKNNILERMYVPLKDGKKIAMPRYYKDKIYNETEKNNIAESIKFIAEQELKKDMQKYGDEYFAIKAEQHINSFNKMYKNAERTTQSQELA